MLLTPTMQFTLSGKGTGISCFATNSEHKLLVYADKVRPQPLGIFALVTQKPKLRRCICGISLTCVSCLQSSPPQLYVYQYSGKGAGFVEQTVLEDAAELDVTAVAISWDGERIATASSDPDRKLIVWDWTQVRLQLQWLRFDVMWRLLTRPYLGAMLPITSDRGCLGFLLIVFFASSFGSQREILTTAKLTSPVSMISFNPYDSKRICTSGSGEMHLWETEEVPGTSLPPRCLIAEPSLPTLLKPRVPLAPHAGRRRRQPHTQAVLCARACAQHPCLVPSGEDPLPL